ncbi:uncharacterized protein [Parasteatoda tepidariorum]|uniref:uncharacterized protein n=1 Tax=Parasteatoda tepidariorum TaxID=114398 RepID=UPI0039BD5023
MLDYDKLDCKNQFYVYAMCVRNGTRNEEVSGKVNSCVKEAFKACPEDALDRLIEIIIGAVDGHGGKITDWVDEIESARKAEAGAEDDYPHYPSHDSCDESKIGTWIKELKKCCHATIKKKRKLKRVMQNVDKCLKRTAPKGCNLDNYSQFNELFHHVIAIIKDYMKRKKGKDECSDSIDSDSMKDCSSKFFLYAVNIQQHINNRKDKILYKKVKVCFHSALKACELWVVDAFITIDASIIMVPIPNDDKPDVIITTTYPDQSVVTCFATNTVPIITTTRKQRKTLSSKLNIFSS